MGALDALTLQGGYYACARGSPPSANYLRYPKRTLPTTAHGGLKLPRARARDFWMARPRALLGSNQFLRRCAYARPLLYRCAARALLPGLRRSSGLKRRRAWDALAVPPPGWAGAGITTTARAHSFWFRVPHRVVAPVRPEVFRITISCSARGSKRTLVNWTSGHYLAGGCLVVYSQRSQRASPTGWQQEGITTWRA